MQRFILSIATIIVFQNLSGQIIKGTIYSVNINDPIEYVSIGILGKNIGTVSDTYGTYSLKLDSSVYNDSIRFSMIGFNSSTFLVKDFISQKNSNVYLTPKSYNIPEASIKYKKGKKIVLGIKSVTNNQTGIGLIHRTGGEMGINVFLKKEVLLKDINFEIYQCPYDSVIFRLNIYRLEDSLKTSNILNEPIYFRFTKNEIQKILTFDLRKYNIVIKNNILITLEHLGKWNDKRIMFNGQYYPTAYTWYRSASEGIWHKAPSIPIIYLNGLLVKSNSLNK